MLLIVDKARVLGNSKKSKLFNSDDLYTKSMYRIKEKRMIENIAK